MGGVAKAVTKVASKAIETVGDAVEDVGDVVVEEVVKPIAKTVEATVEAAAEDPLGTAAKIAAYSTMNPAIIAATNAAVAVANGASLEDAAKTAAVSYVAGEVAQGVSTELQPEFASSGDLTASQAATAAKVAGNVAATAVTGADPLQALVAGGVSAGTAAVTSDIPGFNEMSKAQQAAVNSAVSKTLQGGDASQNLINEAIVAGVSAAQNYASGTPSQPAPSDALVEQTITPAAAEEPVIATPPVEPVVETNETPAPSDEIMPTVEPYTGGQSDSKYSLTSGMDLGGTGLKASMGELDPNDLYSFNPTNTGGEGINYDFASSVGNLSDMGGGQGLTMTNPQTGETTGQADSSLESLLMNDITGKPLGAELASIKTGAEDYLYGLDDKSNNTTNWGDVARTLLKAMPTAAAGYGIASGLDYLLKDDSKDGYGATTYRTNSQDVSWNPQDSEVKNGVYYGTDQLGSQYTPKAAQGGIMSLANGGPVPSLGGYAAGGNPRLLRGPGDGMSDNIPATIAGKQPARLADGEFVVPADVVSHLGNGSTEAGANVLHQMMERVRKARTGNPNQGRQINPQKFVPRKGK